MIAERLRSRVAAYGSAPLITYYDLGTGERTELSATSFANWVDKTANLLSDELLLTAGEVVDLMLAVEAPGHWLTYAWQAACWQVGLAVSVGRADPGAALVVTGPERIAEAATAGVDVLACALDPYALGFTQALPTGVADYLREVRGQPDWFPPTPQSGSSLAWLDEQQTLTQADLIAVAAGPPRRRLVQPTDPWATCRDGLLAALVSGGSTVVVVGEDPARLDRIAETERADR